ncbi:crotonase/enoyl-CoA hydratase family protein [Parasphingopyxis algicola]|uniref:crotonase/enoyl-CoA hydratase family protein n=1 Tax=Parasphingopyxis algicola TaxID=2026624 RepID=UPI001FE7FAE3|nr:crotonase/enoyl-CoA hydratase family protein [Parasphingopyxis algicola]
MDQSRIGSTDSQTLPNEVTDALIDETDLQRVARARPSPLFDLGQLDVSWDEERKALWTYMTPNGRPSFNLAMLHDFDVWQNEIARLYGEGGEQLEYLILGSRFPGVWNFGGDLGLFSQYIRGQNRQALVDYGRACNNILFRNMKGLELPIVTIGLVQGQALGGGFEALMSFNVIVAERSAKFGLPEIAFGLFPGMGAHALLARRLGFAKAESMILSGKTYTAEEMLDLGLVHYLVEDGEGEQAVLDYIGQNSRRHAGNHAVFKASREVWPVTLGELNSIVEIWADTALKLQDSDLRLMERLVRAQSKLSAKISAN